MPIDEEELKSNIQKLYEKRDVLVKEMGEITDCIKVLEQIKMVEVPVPAVNSDKKYDIILEKPIDPLMLTPITDERRQEIYDSISIKTNAKLSKQVK